MSVFKGRCGKGAMRRHRERKRVEAQARNAAYRLRCGETGEAVELWEPEPWRQWHWRTNANSADGYCEPCEKRIFDSRQRGRRAIRSLNGKGMRAYPCPAPTGTGWHIGHNRKQPSEGLI